MVTINSKVSPKKYAVGMPAVRGFNDDCQEFAAVTHVTHAFRATEILRSKVVASRLVYDASTLNDSRIHVVWVSPNYWAHGSRYGTVAIVFDWSELVRTRTAYWIEVAEYQPHACRILLTSRVHKSLAIYDPTTRNGPWWHDTGTGKHFFNSKYCVEFMVEGDLQVSDADETRFVSHHANFCSEYRTRPRSCSDLGKGQQEAAGRAVALIVGSGASGSRLKFSENSIKGAWGWIATGLAGDPQGKVTCQDPLAGALATSALWLYGTERDDEAEALLSLFVSEREVRLALRTSIEVAFQLPSASLK